MNAESGRKTKSANGVNQDILEQYKNENQTLSLQVWAHYDSVSQLFFEPWHT